MRLTSFYRVCITFAVLAVAGLVAAEDLTSLTPRGYVNDYAGVIDSESVFRIQNLCKNVEQKTTAQIAVVTIHSLDGLSPESYGRNLFNRWGIGPRDTNKGILVLLAVDDHQYRIQVGTGLEAVVTDRKSAGFGKEIVPYLRREDYGSALYTLTRRIADAIAADARVDLAQDTETQPTPLQNLAVPERAVHSDILIFVAMFAGFVILVLVIVLWRRKSSRGSTDFREDEPQDYRTTYDSPHHYYDSWNNPSSYSNSNITFLNINSARNSTTEVVTSDNAAAQPEQSWAGGGSFGGGSGFSGFGGGSSSGGGSSGGWGAVADLVSSFSSSSSSSGSSSSSSDGGGSSDGGSSGSW